MTKVKRSKLKRSKVKRVKRTMKRSLKRRSFRKTKRLKRTKRTQINRRTKRTKRTKRKKRTQINRRTKRMKGGSAEGAGDPPMGYCWKQKPKGRWWPKRYVKIEGKALNVYDDRDSETPRGSSIPDLTGAVVTTGTISWNKVGWSTEYLGETGDNNLLTIDYIEGGVKKSGKFAFSKREDDVRLSDGFRTAIQNISEGRDWNMSAERLAGYKRPVQPGPPESRRSRAAIRSERRDY
jgi:hypothetical protein